LLFSPPDDGAVFGQQFLQAPDCIRYRVVQISLFVARQRCKAAWFVYPANGVFIIRFAIRTDRNFVGELAKGIPVGNLKERKYLNLERSPLF